MKLLLALLALLTGFSVAEDARVAGPSVEQPDDMLRAAWFAAENVQVSAQAAVLLVTAVLPIVLVGLPGKGWAAKPALGTVTATVHRSDRLRQ